MTDSVPQNSSRLNEDTLGELESMVGTEALAGIVERHFEVCETDLPKIEALAAQADLEPLRRSAHSFKGSFITVGAPTAAALARRLEQAATDGDTAAIDSLLPEFLSEAQADLAALRDRFRP